MIDLTETQAFYRLAYNSEGHDCSVRALAVTCAAPYDIAHAAMHFAGRGPETAASMHMIETAARSLGFRLYPIVVKAKTMRTLCRELRSEPGCYIAETVTHVAGFWQGECIDWSRNTLTRIVTVHLVARDSR